uniref:autotransporter family protein n=1 Tax=Castellaniella defragrans TaxID=75697 RepID=UPI003340FD0F
MGTTNHRTKRSSGAAIIVVAVAALALTPNVYAVGIDNDVVVPGTYQSPWNINGELYVGENLQGTLTIENDGAVSNNSGYIGLNQGSTGTVEVTGSASKWTNNNGLTVGSSGSGRLTISNGGTVSNIWNGYISLNPGSIGAVEVTGSGSRWINDNELIVGDYGTGSLTITDGGSTSNAGGFIGHNDNSTGTVKVTGNGSTWTNSGDLYIGSYGNATLTIEDGGSVSNTDGYIGAYTDSKGTVTVSGSGSTWTNSGDLAFGYKGSGQLTISNGGIVTATTVYLPYFAAQPQSSGTINIGSAAGDHAVAPGILNASAVIFGPGNGTLVFNHTGTADDNYEFAAPISGSNPGNVNVLAGVTTLTGLNTYSGATAISGGMLRAGIAEAFSAASDYDVANAGTLDANGLNQTLASLANGGTVMIGSQGSAGAVGAMLTVADDYTGNGGSLVLRTVLGGDNSMTDQLVVRNNTSGASVVTVQNAGGTGAQTIEGIEIISVGGVSAGEFTLAGNYIVAGAYTYRLHKNNQSGTDPNDWYLRSTLTPVDPVDPEPEYHVGSPAYEAYPQALLGLNGLSTLQQRMGNRRWAGAGNRGIAQGANAVTPDAPSEETRVQVDGNGVWARVEGGYSHLDPRFSTTDTRINQNVFKLQAGIDRLLSETRNGALIGGVSAQYVHGRTRTRSTHYADANVSTDGYGLAGTLTWYGDNDLYIDGQAQATWYGSDLTTTEPGRTHALVEGNDGFGYALSVETGKRIALDPQWSVTPQAQLVYSRVDFDAFTDVHGSRISLDRGESLQGRLGLMLDHQSSWQAGNGRMSRARVYGIANLYYEFLDGTAITIQDVSFASRQDRVWGGLGAGVSYNWNDGKYSLYGEGIVSTSLDSFADSYSLKGNIGFRARW